MRIDVNISASQFEADGYISGFPVLDRAGAGRVRSQFDALEAVEGRERCQIGLLDRHFDQRFVWDLATHPVILDAVAQVLGLDFMLLATHFFCKYPAEDVGREPSDARRAAEPLAVPAIRAAGRDLSSSDALRLTPDTSNAAPERFVAWHQDVTYWGLEPPMAVTAWYAVDDSDAENGCMRAIPGTHRDGIREHGKAERAGNLLSINQEVPVTPEEEARAVDLTLHAGEISLHHGMLIHGSNPNRSPRRRCGLTLRYIPTSVRQVTLNSHGRGYAAVLVHGVDRYGHFEPRPFAFSE